MVENIIIFFAKYLHLVIIGGVILCVLLCEKKIKRQILLLSVFSLPTAFIIGRIVNKLIIHPRPFVEGNFVPLVPHIPDNGFPSEHTLLAVTLALIVLYSNKKWGIVLLILSMFVGLGRVWAGVHRPSDIIGSIVISVVVVSSVYIILKRKKNI